MIAYKLNLITKKLVRIVLKGTKRFKQKKSFRVMSKKEIHEFMLKSV